jgi:PAS domain S-box-containing protein
MHYSGMLSARFIGVAEPAGRVVAENGKMAAVVACLPCVPGCWCWLVIPCCATASWRQKRRREARLQAVVDTAVDGIISMDARGRVLEMNRAAELLFGWQSAELVGHNINMLMPEPYRSGHDGYLAHYLQTGDARVIGVGREVSARRKRDGRCFPSGWRSGGWIPGASRCLSALSPTSANAPPWNANSSCAKASTAP